MMEQVHYLASGILRGLTNQELTPEIVVDPWNINVGGAYSWQLQLSAGVFFAMGFLTILFLIFRVMMTHLWQRKDAMKILLPQDEEKPRRRAGAFGIGCFFLFGILVLIVSGIGIFSSASLSASVQSMIKTFEDMYPTIPNEQKVMMQDYISKNQEVFNNITNNQYFKEFQDAVQKVPEAIEATNISVTLKEIDSVGTNVQQQIDGMSDNRITLLFLARYSFPKLQETASELGEDISGILDQFQQYYDFSPIDDIMAELNQSFPKKLELESLLDSLEKKIVVSLSEIDLATDEVSYGIRRCLVASNMEHLIPENMSGMAKFTRLVWSYYPLAMIVPIVLYVLFGSVIVTTTSGAAVYASTSQKRLPLFASFYLLSIAVAFIVCGLLVPRSIVTNDACEMKNFGAGTNLTSTAPTCASCNVDQLTLNWSSFKPEAEKIISDALNVSVNTLEIVQDLKDVEKSVELVSSGGNVPKPSRSASWTEDLSNLKKKINNNETVTQKAKEFIQDLEDAAFELQLNSIEFYNSFILIRRNLTEISASVPDTIEKFDSLSKEVIVDHIEELVDFDLMERYGEKLSKMNSTICDSQSLALNNTNNTDELKQKFEKQLCENVLVSVDSLWIILLVLVVVFLPLVFESSRYRVKDARAP